LGLLDGRVVVVSGAGPGLGRETAAAALREGARVVLGDLEPARAEAIRAELDPQGERSLAAHLDITSEERCQALVAAADARFGRIDGLVHVAAFDTPVGGLLDGGFEDWDRSAEVNVKGTLRMTRAAVPLLRVRGGSIVVISSVAAFRPRVEVLRFAYGASKGALFTAARYLARELGPLGIRINTIAPGWKWGPVLEQWAREEAVRRGISWEDMLAWMHADVSLHQLATDADIANSVVFFLCELSSRVTGQCLVVDGGSYLG
jgi:NAD(P)-dependent dehydrogenase (short-subunit alcohol dehydrogenase family)